MSEPYIIGATSIENEFSAHLELPDNKRLLFSAGFGSGKSYFLKEYFSTHTEKFVTVKLHPVDYTVSSNEDIFEVIKHDLLIQLVEDFDEDIHLQKEDVTMLVAGKLWADNKLNILPFLKALGKVLPGVAESTEALQEVRQVFRDMAKYKSDLKVDEEELLIKFLVKERLRSGSIREMDGMTSMINELIGRIKTKHEGKEFILIVDDMDRLDPEHIFRLFNIFSAHYESRTEENKFGFDKVLFVCDINNIAHIYAHKYGPKVEFEGYINKFYSREIFNFDFRTQLAESLVSFFISSFGIEQSTLLTQEDTQYFFGTDTSKFAEVLQYLIRKLISVNAIKARNFTKLNRYEITKQQIPLSTNHTIETKKYPFFTLVNILRQFFPRLSDLEENLSKLSVDYKSDYNGRKSNRRQPGSGEIMQIIEWSLPFTQSDDRILTNLQSADQLDFETPTEDTTLIYGRYLNEYGKGTRLTHFQNTQINNQDQNPSNRPNPFWYLLNAIIQSKAQGFIKE
ncbi:P-loop NTPase fold protein [Pedobacter sp. JCM 36344]|uniref:P-loop NTPase fold protein n=1 Tax=Pedobacter sp. JCM 36344 TaxID=3374280 RepID=UPI003978990D